MIHLFYIGFLEVRWADVIDILMVAFLFYHLFQLIRGTVATKVFIGLIAIYGIYQLVKAMQMELLSAILGQFIGVGIIAAIILFQQEIRRFLMLLGKTTSFNKDAFLSWNKAEGEERMDLKPVLEAVKALSATNTGALIVFARSSELRFYAETGDPIDAIISKRLLVSIFNKYSPLHDGAVIIASGKLKAARCILPITENDNLPAYFGMRHRAGIGLTEITDGVVLIVSEETGQVSIASAGKIFHNLSPAELSRKLHIYVFEDEERIRLEEEGYNVPIPS